MSGHPGPAVPVGHVEPVPRRIRARLGGRFVLDTVRAVHLWEWPFYPQYCIPVADIDPAALVEGDDLVALPHGLARPVALRRGAGSDAAGHRYVHSAVLEIVDTVRFD